MDSHPATPAPPLVRRWRWRRALVVLIALMTVGSAALATAGALSAARGGTLTVMHATDRGGAVVAEAARYQGPAGVRRGAVEAVGLVVSALLLLWPDRGGGLRGALRVVGAVALAGWWAWMLWHAVRFALHEDLWSWMPVAFLAFGVGGALLLGFRRPATTDVSGPADLRPAPVRFGGPAAQP